MKYVKSRPTAQEIKDMHAVVLCGIDERIPSLKVVGWVEDAPHLSSDEAIVLYEPLYFQEATVGNAPTLNWVTPFLAVPSSIEFFEYNKVEMYEGVSPFATYYFRALFNFREIKPEYSMKTIPMPEPMRQQQPQPQMR